MALSPDRGPRGRFYSLGLLLCELLTGTGNTSGSIAAPRRIEVERFGTILRGDLNWTVTASPQPG